MGASSGAAGVRCSVTSIRMPPRPCADRARNERGSAEHDMRCELEPQSFDRQRVGLTKRPVQMISETGPHELRRRISGDVDISL